MQSLTPEQRKKTMFPVDDVEWRKWANQDIYIRQGVSFLDMDASQRQKAFDLMKRMHRNIVEYSRSGVTSGVLTGRGEVHIKYK